MKEEGWFEKERFRGAPGFPFMGVSPDDKAKVDDEDPQDDVCSMFRYLGKTG